MRLKNFGFTMLLGDLTADPLFFLTSAGTPKLTFRLAVDRLAPDTLERPNGGAQTDFFQLVALGPQWGDLDLVRGDRVLVLTKPRSEDITTQEGVERVATYFRVARLWRLRSQGRGRYELVVTVHEETPHPAGRLIQLTGYLADLEEQDV